MSETVVIFETHDKFPKVVFDEKGKILQFNRQNVNLVRSADGNLVRLNKSDSWICTLTEEDKIERAKQHKSFKKIFGSLIKFQQKRIMNRLYNQVQILLKPVLKMLILTFSSR